MAYTAEISLSNPTAFLFLVDQSASMEDEMVSGTSKAQYVADVLNRTLFELIIRCARADGVRDYFDVGVIAYGGANAYNGFQGALSTNILNPISAVESSPIRIDERQQKVSDGAGGLVEESIKFEVWFDPRSSGGTPMCQAIMKAAEALATWCDSHMSSYPPTVLHITDGKSTDGDPEELATQLKQIGTDEGAVLMFNLHVSTSGVDSIKFPVLDSGLDNAYANLLFRMSSVLPDHMVTYAQNREFRVNEGSRGFIFNGGAEDIVYFLEIGTRQAQDLR